MPPGRARELHHAQVADNRLQSNTPGDANRHACDGSCAWAEQYVRLRAFAVSALTLRTPSGVREPRAWEVQRAAIGKAPRSSFRSPPGSGRTRRCRLAPRAAGDREPDLLDAEALEARELVVPVAGPAHLEGGDSPAATSSTGWRAPPLRSAFSLLLSGLDYGSRRWLVREYDPEHLTMSFTAGTGSRRL